MGDVLQKDRTRKEFLVAHSSPEVVGNEAATQFHYLYEAPKLDTQLCQVLTNYGEEVKLYNRFVGGFPEKYLAYLEEARRSWVDMILTGSPNRACGQLSEILVYEMLKSVPLGNHDNNHVAISCAQQDFTPEIGIDLLLLGPSIKFCPRDRTQTPFMFLGIDVVRDTSTYKSFPLLREKGYFIIRRKGGQLVTLLDFSRSENQGEYSTGVLLNLAIDVLRTAALQGYSINSKFSVIECANALQNKQEFAELFQLHAVSNYVLYRRMLEGMRAYILKEKAFGWEQYANYIENIINSIPAYLD